MSNINNNLNSPHRGMSCLLPVYKNDNPTHLWLALDSVVKQTRTPDQLVIVEDGPITSQLSAVIDEFRSQIFMTNVKLPKNLGLGLALGVAIDACNFDYIVRMDADDIARPTRFELQEEIMFRNPNVVLVGGGIEEFSESQGDLSRVRLVPLTDVAIRKRARTQNPFCHVTVCFLKSAVLAAGNYRHNPGFEDYDLWLRMMMQPGAFLNVDDILVDVRVGNGMLKRRRGWNYLLTEMRFLKSSWQQGLISGRSVFLSSLIRIPSRLIPVFALEFLYSKILRRRS